MTPNNDKKREFLFPSQASMLEKFIQKLKKEERFHKQKQNKIVRKKPFNCR
ncbi:hypothetical protein ACFL35_09220 [Candidatus Riflebacteria bacterium]